jgi:APA family basic amino acid/polyamine antiporter
MVGVGVLTTSGYTVYFVGSNQYMLALWVLGGLTAACGALTLCELTAALPRSGGDYVYLHEAYGPLVAFLSGWVSFVIGFSAPAASAALAASKYLVTPFGLAGEKSGLLQPCLATVLILTFAAIHTTGRKQTARVQGWVTTVKLVLLGMFMFAGLVAGRGNTAHLADPRHVNGPLLLTMLSSLVYISYAYIGWNAASYLAGEFADPQRQLPRAILLGTGAVVVLYLGMNLVYALALSADDVKRIVDGPDGKMNLARVDPIAEISARQLFGAGVSRPFSFAVGLMLLSSLSAYLLAGPRVVYAMAVAGQFPAVATRLTKRAETPAVASALVTACTLTFVWVGTLASLVEYASVGLAIFSMLAIGSVFVLRVTRPDLHRPFRTPGYPITPAFYLVVTGALTGAAFWKKQVVSTYALLSILAGVPIFYLWRALAAPRQPPSA